MNKQELIDKYLEPICVSRGILDIWYDEHSGEIELSIDSYNDLLLVSKEEMKFIIQRLTQVLELYDLEVSDNYN